MTTLLITILLCWTSFIGEDQYTTQYEIATATVSTQTTNTITQRYDADTIAKQERSPYGFQEWAQGIFFMFFLYHFILYFRNRNRILLYYCGFVGCLLICFMHYGPKMFYLDILLKKSSSSYYVAQFMAYFFYAAYARELLQTKRILPVWDRVLYGLQIVLLTIYVPASIILYIFLEDKDAYRIIMVLFILLALTSIIYCAVMYKFRSNTIVRLWVIGAASYTIFGILALVIKIQSTFFDYIHEINNVAALEVGAIIESICFALSTGYRINEIEIEKKEAELQLLQKSIETAELKAEAYEAKVVALKTQMNPHFIFNALNSIHHYIITNDSQQASSYLIEFSSLIGTILKNSSETTITLQEEIDTIERYISLEKMRIQNGFIYQYECDPNVALDTILVPPLFLQPYIENAIWHGLSLLEHEKILVLTIQNVNTHIQIKIQDNGLGREAVAKLQSKSNKKSYGTTITQERINAVYKNAKINTEDVLDAKQNTCGTVVTILIPLS